ncbi:hypothetical protein [Streptomyces sp. 6N106]|uniref:hypothetical protein n=1 Tax=Streptomyces sp. 6N106 TaxID=3457418 RepID=UPI003FD2BAEA
MSGHAGSRMRLPATGRERIRLPRPLLGRVSATEPVRRANRGLPEHIWHSALEQGGGLRAGAPVAEPTGVIDLTN